MLGYAIKRTWLEVVQRDRQVHGLSRDDGDGRWWKLIRMVDEQEGSDECFFWYWLTRVVPDKGS